MPDASVEPGTFVNEFVNEYYRFATTSLHSVTTTASVLQANPTANDSFGVAGLNAEWLEQGSSAAFADASSVTESTAKLIATLASSGSRDADAYGAALTDGGEYSLQLAAKDGGASPVPLRPAMLLLGSALVGFAFVGLRRRAAQGADPNSDRSLDRPSRVYLPRHRPPKARPRPTAGPARAARTAGSAPILSDNRLDPRLLLTRANDEPALPFGSGRDCV